MIERDYILTIVLPLAVVLIIAAMRYFARIQQAKTSLADSDAYRTLAERAAATEAETASALQGIQATLSDLRTRLVSVEAILKDVG
jgi:hypothetical protein